MCISNNDNDASTIQISTNQEPDKIEFYLDTIGSFPGSRRNAISVNIYSNGSALLDDNTDGQIPICGDACEDNSYCVDGTKIKVGKENTCNDVEINNNETGKQILFFDENNNNIDDTNTVSSSVKKAYECESGNGNEGSINCIVLDKKSTVIENAGILTCNALDGCELEAPTDQDKFLYELMDSNKCLYNYNTCRIKDDNMGYLYSCIYNKNTCDDNENNENCNENNSNSVNCDLIEDVGYYIDEKDLYTCANKGNVIECTKSTKPIENENKTCNENNIGEVIYKDNTFVICTGANTSDNLLNESKVYIISGKNADDTYGLTEDQYGFINASDISVIFNSNGSGK